IAALSRILVNAAVRRRLRNAIIYNSMPYTGFINTGATMNGFPGFDLKGKTALVTGAARGLGRAISLALANAGANLALGLRDVSTGGELTREIERLGRKAVPLQMEMSKLDQVSNAVQHAADHFGQLHILVNNAGIAPENLAENVTEKDFDA